VPTPLQGTSGVITWGGTNVVWAGTWTYSMENEVEEIGPHIGDATIYEVNTSQKHEWTIEGTVPSAGDAGQNAIMAAAGARTTAALVLEQTLGKTITFSAANVRSLEINTEADGTQTFSAEGGNGAGTVVLSQDT
jgi:hypothetical protein